jgi:serine/threonine protein phosphatase PrpC
VSITGHVRKENQDAVLAVSVGEWAIAVCADGLGGLPLGRDASLLAVETAATWLSRHLARTPEIHPQALSGLVLSSLFAAQEALEERAEALALPPGGGLRTTLIVVLAGPGHWAFAHAGDGFGIRILPLRGKVESWLEPQKGLYANEVACSLGPRMEGVPRAGTFEREPEEILAFGSDGIGDQVDLEGFGLHLLERVRTARSDLFDVCGDLLDECSELGSDAGYLFDDNLSLVVLQTSRPGGGTC